MRTSQNVSWRTTSVHYYIGRIIVPYVMLRNVFL